MTQAPKQEKTDGSDKLKHRLDALGERLTEHSDEKAKAEAAERKPGYAQALRLSSEFIAGIVAGGLIGYVLDTFAGTTPWGMIVFLLLGFVSGVLNVLRSAGTVAQPDRRIGNETKD